MNKLTIEDVIAEMQTLAELFQKRQKACEQSQMERNSRSHDFHRFGGRAATWKDAAMYTRDTIVYLRGGSRLSQLKLRDGHLQEKQNG